MSIIRSVLAVLALGLSGLLSSSTAAQSVGDVSGPKVMPWPEWEVASTPGAIAEPDVPKADSVVAGAVLTTFLGAVAGSSAGAMAAYYSALRSPGESGAEDWVLLGLFTAAGSAGGGTLFSGSQNGPTLERAFVGAVLGIASGLVGARFAREVGFDRLVGFALGQGLATTIGIHARFP